MKAVIKLDVPEFQIGEPVTVYFRDTMYKEGICEADETIYCKDCKYSKPYSTGYGDYLYGCKYGNRLGEGDWHCADAERKTE